MKLKSCFCLTLIAVLASIGPASAQTFSVLHAFTGTGDGANPTAGVTLRGGALFGTTYSTTIRAGDGSVFEMQRAGNTWALTPIYKFSGPDGRNPNARVVFGPDSHLYGTTQYGDASPGTVFQLTPPLNICKTAFCPWSRKLVTDFPFQGFIGIPSTGDLVWDAEGNIYGTTTSFVGHPGVGVYQSAPAGNSWTTTVLTMYTQGQLSPSASSGVLLNDGNIFGAMCCGSIGHGFVYESQNVNGTWNFTDIYDFSGGTDGGDPRGALVADGSGNLYGTTASGGSGGGGTFFELSPSGNTWTLQVLYNFSGPANCGPGGLIADGAGNLYGATNCDGVFESGNVFKLIKTQNSWVYTSLYDFEGTTDGRFPNGQVAIDTDGTLYGTTIWGGNITCGQSEGCGVVWMIKP